MMASHWNLSRMTVHFSTKWLFILHSKHPVRTLPSTTMPKGPTLLAGGSMLHQYPTLVGQDGKFGSIKSVRLVMFTCYVQNFVF
jgi:hypothetical protein